MRTFAFALALLLAACTTEAERRQEAVLDQIEQSLSLPAEARKLDKYARYYAQEGNRVVGRLITEFDPSNPYYDLPIGQRRWVANHKDLPRISDGGCEVVNLVYDSTNRRIEWVSCNGV